MKRQPRQSKRAVNAVEDARQASVADETRRRIEYMKGHRDEILGRLAGIATRCAMMYISRRLTPFELGTGQAFILAELLWKDGRSQDDLRHVMKMDKGTVTRALQQLEDREYIHREHDEHDRRVTRVFVTDKARDIEHELFAILLEWNAAIAKGLTPEEQHQAAGLLRRIVANAEAMAYADPLASATADEGAGDTGLLEPHARQTTHGRQRTPSKA